MIDGKGTNPMTNLTLQNKILIPHRSLKRKIDEFQNHTEKIVEGDALMNKGLEYYSNGDKYIGTF